MSPMRGVDGNFDKIKAYELDMTGHADQAVDKYCELSGKLMSSLKYFAKPCIEDQELAPEDFET
eukprot:6078390-Karenia_brevis.AAC.1